MLDLSFILNGLGVLSLGVICAAVLPGTVYLGTLTVAALLARWSRRASATRSTHTEPTPAAAQDAQVIVLVPAHNESSNLLPTLNNLQACVRQDAHAHIVVIADNCDDDTATLARAQGVRVLERFDSAHRGKGHALRFGFESLPEADWFIIIDADTSTDLGFLPAMRTAMSQEGVHALQCRYRVRNAQDHWRAALADVAFAGWNILRPLGRHHLGCSAGILGNGFALSRHALQQVPYSASSIVEDVEYHHLLLQAGLRVHWVDQAQVRGDMPCNAQASASQRARWEGGRLRLLREHAPHMCARVLKKQWHWLDPLCDLLTLPLAWQLSLLVLGLSLSLGLMWGGLPSPHTLDALYGGYVVCAVLNLTGLLILFAHVVLACRALPAHALHARALLHVPQYILWKLMRLPHIVRHGARHSLWVRSAREPHPPESS